MGEDAHRFRCFVAGECAIGDEVALSAADAHHMDVIRAREGERIDIVDGAGTLFDAAIITSSTVRVVAQLGASPAQFGQIVLYAGVLTGQRWDALVDGAVQAGVARIIPVAQNQKDASRCDDRRERAHRVAEAAAKQSKRRQVPEITAAVLADGVPRRPAGIVLDAVAGRPLIDVARDIEVEETLPILIGPASGLESWLVNDLVENGWLSASLGDSVLRAELAAAVAVSCVAQARSTL
jgi:16S rRNA (uracil1498-N3)-methyltransferase